VRRIWLAGSLALLALAVFGACGDTAVIPTSAPGGDGAGGQDGAPPCDEEACRNLDSECARGACSSDSGLCVIEAVRDGQPCADGNPCGEARCEAGVCSPSNPPDCSALEDACRVGACSVREGCVAVPRERAGLECERAAPLTLDGIPATLDTSCGAPAQELAVCGAPQGNAVFFELELSGFDAPVPVRLLFGAEFEIESALWRAPCADPAAVACGRTREWTGSPGGVEFREVLGPGRYLVVAAGVDANARGPIQLAAVLDEAPECDTTIERAGCEDALPLDPSLPVQVRLGSSACVESGTDFECPEFSDETEVYYSLDLSERTGDTLVELELMDVRNAALLRVDSDGGCGERLQCGEHLSALLEPAKYVLGVGAWDGDPFAVRVSARDRSACDASSNTSCEQAVVLDPSATTHRLLGQTACGKHVVDDDCGNPESEQQLFYRLDLRNHTTPVHVEVEPVSTAFHNVGLIEANAEGGCGAVTHCYPYFVLLAPRLYYLAVSGGYGRPFEFRVDHVPQPPGVATDCIPLEIVQCAVHSAAACSESGVNDVACVAALEECGLQWSGLAELCSEAPWCCDPDSMPPVLGAGAEETCEELFLAAGARCSGCGGTDCWF
jgi:hypothetical protein